GVAGLVDPAEVLAQPREDQPARGLLIARLERPNAQARQRLRWWHLPGSSLALRAAPAGWRRPHALPDGRPPQAHHSPGRPRHAYQPRPGPAGAVLFSYRSALAPPDAAGVSFCPSATHCRVMGPC